MASILVVNALMAGMAAAGCPSPVAATFDVAVSYGTISVGADMPLAEIAEFARRSGRPPGHVALGFYAGLIQYGVSVHPGEVAEPGCSAPVWVSVQVALSDRHIELGKELVRQHCMFAVARSDYLRHAAAEADLFSEFAHILEATLRGLPLPAADSAYDEVRRANDIAALVSATIEQRIDALDAARLAARDRVDTPAEVERLTMTCQPDPSGGGI